MSAVSKRVYQELLQAKVQIASLLKENAALKAENTRLGFHAKLAYLEGLDQGRDSILQEAV